MEFATTLSPCSSVKRLSYNPECQAAITEVLSASEQLLWMLNHAIRNPRTTLSEIADIIGCNCVLAEQMVRLANSTLFFKNSRQCESVEEALRLVGLREVARLVTTATTHSVASPLFYT